MGDKVEDGHLQRVRHHYARAARSGRVLLVGSPLNKVQPVLSSSSEVGILVAGYGLVLGPLLFEVVHVQLSYERLEGRAHEVLGQHLPKQQLLVLDDHQGAL